MKRTHTGALPLLPQNMQRGNVVENFVFEFRIELSTRNLHHVTITLRPVRNTIQPYQETFANWNFFGIENRLTRMCGSRVKRREGGEGGEGRVSGPRNTRRYPKRHILFIFIKISYQMEKCRIVLKQLAKQLKFIFVSVFLCEAKASCIKMSEKFKSPRTMNVSTLQLHLTCCATLKNLRILKFISYQNCALCFCCFLINARANSEQVMFVLIGAEQVALLCRCVCFWW